MKFFLPLLVVILFSNCASNFSSQENLFVLQKTKEDRKHIFNNLNETIIDLADQLFSSSRLINAVNDKNDAIKVILTSFVELENFEKTTTFGKLISESMFNELHIRHFKVTDFRGQDAVSVNEDGEFHITRDVEKIKDTIEATEYILVGTYVAFEENKQIIINARIIDSVSGDVISTARTIYKKETIRKPKNNIEIVSDKCAGVTCFEQKCKDGICDNSVLY